MGRLTADHTDTITARNTLANVFREMGRNDSAILIAEQTLTMGIPKFGPKHPSGSFGLPLAIIFV